MNTPAYSVNKLLHIGTAHNAKLGACLVTDGGVTYYIESMGHWNKPYLDKRIAINGEAFTIESNEPLKNESGEYKAGSEETANYLRNIVLPDKRNGISVILVFKEEDEEALQFLNDIHYPSVEGIDSSKGKMYFHRTGKKYFIFFPSISEQINFIREYSTHELVHEIYLPDWTKEKE